MLEVASVLKREVRRNHKSWDHICASGCVKDQMKFLTVFPAPRSYKTEGNGRNDRYLSGDLVGGCTGAQVLLPLKPNNVRSLKESHLKRLCVSGGRGHLKEGKPGIPLPQ